MPSFAEALKRRPPSKPAVLPSPTQPKSPPSTIKPTSHPPPKKKSKSINATKNAVGGGGRRKSTGSRIGDRSSAREDGGYSTHHSKSTKQQQQQPQQQVVKLLKRNEKPSMKVDSLSDFPSLGAPSGPVAPLAGKAPQDSVEQGHPVTSAPHANSARFRPKGAPWGQLHPPRPQQPPQPYHVAQRVVRIASSSPVSMVRTQQQTQPARPKATTAASAAKPALRWATATKHKPGGIKQHAPRPTVTPDAPSKKRKKKKKSSGTELTPKAVSSSILEAFTPKQRTQDDDPLYMTKFKLQTTTNKRTPNAPLEIKKGRQRLTPRKKKFTSLKKKILQERLDQWRQSQKRQGGTAANSASASTEKVVILHEYATIEQGEDEDEYEELVSFLESMASKVGPTKQVVVPQGAPTTGSDMIDAMVLFQDSDDARAAQATWNGWILGGEPMRTSLVTVATSVDDFGASSLAEAVSKARQEECKLIVQLRLHNILTEDDLEDDDCLEETLSDISQVFGHPQTDVKFVPPTDVLVTITTASSSPLDVSRLLDRLNTTKLGGQTICATLESNEEEHSHAAKPASVIVLANVLTEDDLEDDDCLQETLRDIRVLVEKSNSTTRDVRVGPGQEVHVTVPYSLDEAQSLVQTLSGTVLGGQVLEARLLAPQAPAATTTSLATILLQNVLTEDDLEDEDCLEESLSDLKELASRWGVVDKVDVDLHPSVKILIQGGIEVGQKVAESFHGMVIGGQTVTASVVGNEGTPIAVTSDTNGPELRPSSSATVVDQKPKPMYSGDKLISERFAEMKRVPKIPTKPEPREYAKVKAIDDESVKPLLTELLGELMRLQKRSQHEENNNNARARRRLVLGLREVARGIRAHKVKMVVMANNLDEYGALDAKLQELLDLAKAEDVPVFFEFNKRKLGKALGKNIKIAVVGVQNADGAHAPYKKLQQLASRYGLV